MSSKVPEAAVWVVVEAMILNAGIVAFGRLNKS
jgi:hypothetical protein